MCTVCGCGEGEMTIEHAHEHEHNHGHHHAPEGSRLLRIEQDLLAKNNTFAAENRAFFQQHGVLALNLVSSPGSGKTTLLCQTITALNDSLNMAVIEGDQQSNRDADRIRETGAKAIQINTGKGCHLDAHMVGHALATLQAQDNSLLFIENVGNLVCPAAFDLGESQRVVILSVTEGDDKPLKYPDMFASAHLMLMTKIDLLPYVDFDMQYCIEQAKKVNPNIRILQLSARSGEGMGVWFDWLKAMFAVEQVGYTPSEVS